MYRAYAPDADLSPRLPALITQQLQERVVQEAELLLARVQSGAVPHYDDTQGTVARLVRTEASAPTPWLDAERTVPQWDVARLVPDAARAQRLVAHVERTAQRGGGWVRCGGGGGGWALARHTHTAPMFVACWRLDKWLASAPPDGDAAA